jgi:hypothetical protein
MQHSYEHRYLITMRHVAEGDYDGSLVTAP